METTDSQFDGSIESAVNGLLSPELQDSEPEEQELEGDEAEEVAEGELDTDKEEEAEEEDESETPKLAIGEDAEMITDLTEDGQQFVLCTGGRDHRRSRLLAHDMAEAEASPPSMLLAHRGSSNSNNNNGNDPRGDSGNRRGGGG